MYIFSHIPKTAGTALAVIFDYGSNRRIFYDYNLERDMSRNHRVDKLDPQEMSFLDFHRDFLLDRVDFVHGHFCIKKYFEIIPSAKLMSCFRDPLSRLISHYYHVIDEANEDFWLFNEIKNGGMDLVDLAKTKYVGDLQVRYMSGVEIEDLDHIFINEHLAESVYQFQLIHNFKRNDPYMNFTGEKSIPRVNFKTDRGATHRVIGKTEAREARKFLEQEYDLYNRALDVFSRQKKVSRKKV